MQKAVPLLFFVAAFSSFSKGAIKPSSPVEIKEVPQTPPDDSQEQSWYPSSLDWFFYPEPSSSTSYERVVREEYEEELQIFEVTNHGEVPLATVLQPEKKRSWPCGMHRLIKLPVVVLCTVAVVISCGAIAGTAKMYEIIKNHRDAWYAYWYAERAKKVQRPKRL